MVGSMHKKGMVNLKQKGELKDLIISKDAKVFAALKEYDIDAQQDKLYEGILQALKESKYGDGGRVRNHGN